MMIKVRYGAWMLPVALLLSIMAIFFLSGCNGDDDNNGFTGQTFTVRMTSLDSFDPVTVQVTPGSRITWVNEDEDPHTATVDLQNLVAGGPNSARVFPDGVPSGGSYTFQVPNDVPVGTVWFYHCCNHGAAGENQQLGAGMSGSIVIVAGL